MNNVECIDRVRVEVSTELSNTVIIQFSDEVSRTLT